MPEEELLMEFHQIRLIVVLMGAMATVLFAILYWLLKELFTAGRRANKRGRACAFNVDLLIIQKETSTAKGQTESRPFTAPRTPTGP
jgi:hypothetical protein